MTTPVDQIETVLIPAGAFTIGDDNGRPDERPAHRVTLSAFRMAVLPVTNEEYVAFLATTGHEPPRFWDDSAFIHPRQPRWASGSSSAGRHFTCLQCPATGHCIRIEYQEGKIEAVRPNDCGRCHTGLRQRMTSNVSAPIAKITR